MKILISDLIKSKRTVLFLVIFLAPGLTLTYEVATFLLRSETLQAQAIQKQTDMWHIFLYDKQFILSLALPLTITIAASIIANIEHQANSWKQILALPLSRRKVYFSKFYLLFISSFFSGLFLMLGMILVGFIFQFNGGVPWLDIIADSFLPFLASLPIMALQLGLSLSVKNQAFPIAIGAIFTMAGLFFALSPITQWLPWAYPLNSSTLRLNYDTDLLIANPDLIYVLSLSLVLGASFLFTGAIHFSKKEVY